MAELNYLERMLAIIKENNSNGTKVSNELGISSTSFTDWKKGKGRPVFETVIKFAELFHISLDYIAWGELDNSIPNPSLDPDLLTLLAQLPKEKQIELRGYVRRMVEESKEAASQEPKAG